MIRETWGTSKPRAQTSVEIRTRLKHKDKAVCWGLKQGVWSSWLLLAHLAPDRNSFMMDSLSFWGMSPCMDDTVKLASLIFSVSQSTFLLVLQKITAWVMVRVSYRSHSVSNFHSSLSTATKNCLIPSRVSSSLRRWSYTWQQRDNNIQWESERLIWGNRGSGGGDQTGAHSHEDTQLQSERDLELSPAAIERCGVVDWPFDQDADGVGHEIVGHLQDVVGQRGANQNHLRGWRQVAVHVIDLLLEPCTAEDAEVSWPRKATWVCGQPRTYLCWAFHQLHPEPASWWLWSSGSCDESCLHRKKGHLPA